ncbi:MAG: 2,3-bisphosphoglycerate-independent phosphoglycerate mutase, partial [Bacteroidetes bacterium]|nr:2,3-bisphosphoglycerate-independent phosphoglycerate mutase [Bacteroidota bacterium]
MFTFNAITDGRDVPEKSADKFLKQINSKIKQLGFNKKNGPRAIIASIIGRYFAMDRDNNWDRTQKAYDLYTLGKGIQETDALKAIKNSYQRGNATDYYIDPITLDRNGTINKDDAVIFWNYRTDRTRQITYCFTGEAKIGFKPSKNIHPYFVCFGDYSNKAPVVFPPAKVKNNLGEIIEKNKLSQLRIAETEKYAHVTFFFNSQIEKPFKHEKRILIKSPKVPSYAQKPEMSARSITETIIKEMDKHNYNLIVQNFANPDLVGHSGNLKATIKACEVLDECIGRIAKKALQKGYYLLITADHGNAEY